jgi:hypothetical protein
LLNTLNGAAAAAAETRPKTISAMLDARVWLGLILLP